MSGKQTKASDSNRSRQGTGNSTTCVEQDIPPFTLNCSPRQGGPINFQFTVNDSFDVSQRQRRVRLGYENPALASYLSAQF
ncbi:hypothetical protein TNCV_2460661 [Trichonephila clavipes]|nr:hypothetical protein TNCV_2460661 [Trichonephila clavipes]